jgi:hypothetical protein
MVFLNKIVKCHKFNLKITLKNTFFAQKKKKNLFSQAGQAVILKLTFPKLCDHKKSILRITNS